LLRAFRRRAYIDLDPGWTQLWDDAGLLGETLDDYQVHLTVGDAVTTCGLPLSGRRWQSIRPPVLLSAWPVVPASGSAFTTVGSWRSPSGTMQRHGRELGGKAREWRRFTDLPAKAAIRCKAVVAAHPADDGDLDRLRAGGWSLHDCAAVAHPQTYRAFVQGSAAELSIAQEMYVATACGWTSDRTAGYLASGRPVLVSDTGMTNDLRRSPAFSTFRTLDDAVTACDKLTRIDPAELSSAARLLAQQHFASDVVLPRVLDLVSAT
jgi:hypothetical protein